jgi:RNA recognition motif-containing protein
MWVRNNKGNVFVGNLPPDFPDERLAETFDPFGIVLSAVVARDPQTGARLRYGFVDIANERAANQAISALDGSEIDGCKLNVKPRDKAAAAIKKPRAAATRRPPSTRVGRPGEVLRDAGGGPPPLAPPARPLSPLTAESRGAPPAPAPAKLSPRLSQSQRAREDLPEIEPPPPPLRRDFEVVRRPLRRSGSATPTFQVERRPLPRRGV